MSAFDSKLGPVIDRLSALEKTSTNSTRSGPSSSSVGSAGNTTGPMKFALLTWKSRGGVLLKIEILLVCLKGSQENLLKKLRQGIGSELDSMIARFGAMRVKKTRRSYVT